MENSERLNKINALMSQIADINEEYVKSVTTLKKGDVVEYATYGSSYDGIPSYYVKGEILNFEVIGQGIIYAHISGHHSDGKPSISRLKLFDENDFTLRNQFKEDEEDDL